MTIVHNHPEKRECVTGALFIESKSLRVRNYRRPASAAAGFDGDAEA